MLAHAQFTLRRMMTGLPTASLAQDQALSHIRDASRVSRVERSVDLEAKPCRSMVSGSLSTIG